MSDKLRVGLIGIGYIGSLHARVMAENPRIDFVALADLNKDLAEEFGKNYGCEVYTDYKEMLSREDIDAINICVPEDYHVDVAVDVANAKKDFIIEKPLAKTYEQCKTICQAVEENNVRMMVAHVCKFDPRYATLKEAIRGGKLGDITSMSFKRGNPTATATRLNGNVSFFYYLGIHDIEMMVDYNLPAKPIRVYAQASDKVNGHMNDLDTAQALIEFDNGSIASYQVGWAYPNNSAMGILCTAEVVGTKGASMIEIENQGIQIMTEEELSFPDTLHWPDYNGEIQGDLRAELDHFAKATLENQEYLVDNTSASYAAAIAEAALKSIESKQPVELKL